MIWDNARYSGFLPFSDPLKRLPVITGHDGDYFFCLEFLASNLPTFLEERKWREEAVSVLRSFHPVYTIKDKQPEDFLERMMLLYSYFASAYVYANYEAPANRLPKEISGPLTYLANRVNRQPILSYASYCLYNWQRKDTSVDINVDNIELIQNFSLTNKQDEDWFILIHVDIEDKAKKAIQSICEVLRCYQKEEPVDLEVQLENIHSSLIMMNKTLDRMPEKCNPDNYFSKVRPYIFGFENITYDYPKAVMNLRGETGAQSSIIPTLLSFFEIKHKQSILTTHLLEMRKYMPCPHRTLISNIERQAYPLREICKESGLKDLYNSCLKEIIKFRETHFRYAMEYIQAKVVNPKGTGGTPYIEWLGNLIKETEEFILE
jgi:indoleamine 2,3-dioxygenase